jgi:hypothetical protein
VVADVVLAPANGRKPNGFIFVNGQTRYETVVFWLIRKDVKMLLIGLQNFVESREDVREIIGGLRGSASFWRGS